MFYVWDQQGQKIYYELLTHSDISHSERYLQQMLDLKQALHAKRPVYLYNTELLCFMKLHHQTRQKWSRKQLRHLNGKQFCRRLPHQILLSPITTYLHRCDTYFPSNSSFLTKVYEMSRLFVCFKRVTIILALYPQLPQRQKTYIARDVHHFK